MKLKRTIFRMGVLSLFCLTVGCTASNSNDNPNIVIIYTDDQGYGDVSALNSEAKFKTPNIDKLANEGITFTDGHSSDALCTPSLCFEYPEIVNVLKAEISEIIKSGRSTPGTPQEYVKGNWEQITWMKI